MKPCGHAASYNDCPTCQELFQPCMHCTDKHHCAICMTLEAKPERTVNDVVKQVAEERRAKAEKHGDCGECNDGLCSTHLVKAELETVCAGSNHPVVYQPVSSTEQTWCGVCGAASLYGFELMPTHVRGKPPASLLP